MIDFLIERSFIFPTGIHPPDRLNEFRRCVLRQFFPDSPDQLCNDPAVSLGIVAAYLFIDPFPVEYLAGIHGKEFYDFIFRSGEIRFFAVNPHFLRRVVDHQPFPEPVLRFRPVPLLPFTNGK